MKKKPLYSGVRQIFQRYWQAYGGLHAFMRSAYLHVAMLFLVLTWGSWSQPLWWDQVISVLPNLLGFTLAGFAMFLGFGDERFRALLAEPDDEDEPGAPSIYVSLCASFVHFISVQVLALLFALVAKSLWFKCALPEEVISIMPWLNFIGGAIGYLLFLYAITSVMAATMAIFRIATWYELHKKNTHEDE